MAKDTKERILMAALEMFSQKGYDGTNIRELTASLGLVKSSMYRHFKSKEEIWNCLLDEMIAYYGAHFGSSDNLPPVPDSLEELVAMTVKMTDFTIHDEKIVMTRKVLTIEQFRDERVRDLATKHFLTGLKDMFTVIFTGMMDHFCGRRIRRCWPLPIRLPSLPSSAGATGNRTRRRKPEQRLKRSAGILSKLTE